MDYYLLVSFLNEAQADRQVFMNRNALRSIDGFHHPDYDWVLDDRLKDGQIRVTHRDMLPVTFVYKLNPQTGEMADQPPFQVVRRGRHKLHQQLFTIQLFLVGICLALATYNGFESWSIMNDRIQLDKDIEAVKEIQKEAFEHLDNAKKIEQQHKDPNGHFRMGYTFSPTIQASGIQEFHPIAGTQKFYPWRQTEPYDAYRQHFANGDTCYVVMPTGVPKVVPCDSIERALGWPLEIDPK